METSEHDRHVQWRREVHRPHEIRRYRISDGCAGGWGARKTPQSHPVPHRFARGMRRREDPTCTFRLRYCLERAHIIIQ